MPSNQFGNQPAATGGAANLSNYYTKAETNVYLSGKCTKTAGKLDTSEVPDLALTSVTTVADNTARDALSVQQGDVAYVTGTQITYMWSGSAWVQIDSTSVSWDNVKSSSNQSVTTKFGLVDQALAAAVQATGTTAPYKYLMRNAANTATEWTDIQLKSSGGSGTTLTALGTSYNEDGSQLNSQRTNIGGSSNVGHYVLKKFNCDWPLTYTKSGDNQTIHLGWVGSSGHDGQYLKYNHSTQTATWDAPSTTGGVTTFKNLSDTPGAYTNNAHFGLCVNGNADAVVFRNMRLLSEGTSGITGSTHELVGPSTSIETNYVRRLVAGSNITISQTGDSNQGLLISSTASGGSSGPTINDGIASTTTVWSSTEIANRLNGKAADSHVHVISDVTGLQGALDGKVDDSQIKTSNSTSTTDVYSSSYINDTKNLLGTGSLNNQLLGWTGNAWGAQSVGAAGTYLRSNGTNGLTYHQLIDDTGNGVADKCYSSQKMYADLQNKAPASHNHDSDYIKISTRKNAVSSTSTDIYDAGFINGQLAVRMSNTVTDMGSSGTQLYQVTGNALGLKRLAGGTNVTLSETTSGIVTITASGGSGGGTTIASGNTSSTPHVVWSAAGGGAWVPGKVSLDDIVPTANIGNGKVLKYDGSTSSVTWQDDAQGTSVTLTSLLPANGTNGQILKYDGTSMYWATDATSSGASADGVLSGLNCAGGVLTATLSSGGPVTCDISSSDIGWEVYNAISDLPTASSVHGMVAHVHATGKMYFSHSNGWVELANATDVATNTTNITTNANAIAANLAAIQVNANAIVPIQSTVGTHTSAIASAEADIVTNTNNITLLQNKTHYQSITASSNLTQFSGDIQAPNVVLQNTGYSTLSQTRTTTSSNSYLLGQYEWKGINSASAAKIYGGISFYVNDHTSGLEEGQLSFFYEHNGVTRAPLSLVDSQVRFTDNIKLSGSANLVFKDSTEQSSAVAAPATAGHVLTAAANGTWAWSAPAGGLTPLTSYTSSPNNSSVYSTNVINSRIDYMGTFPSQANQANMFLTTDGSTLGWGTIPVYTTTTTAGVAPNAVYAVTHLNAVHTASDARHTALETKTQDMQLVGAGTLTRFNTSLDIVGFINASSAQSVVTTTTNTALHSANQTLNTYVAEGKNSAQAYKSYSKIRTEAKVGTSGGEYGQLTISTIDNGTVTEKLFVGQASSADADVKVLGALEVASTQYTSVAGTQSRPVTTPGAGDVGKVLTAANGSWSWASAGGSSWTDIDVTSLSTGSSSSPAYNTAYGALYGNRRGLWFIQDHYFTSRGDDGINDSHKLMQVHMSLVNGYKGSGGNGPMGDYYVPRYFGIGGFLDMTPKTPNMRYNYGGIKLYTSADLRSDTQVEFTVYASNDAMNWTAVCTKKFNQTTSFNSSDNEHNFAFNARAYYRLWRFQFTDFGTRLINYASHNEGRLMSDAYFREIEFY